MSDGPMKITRKDAYQLCPEWVLLADISAQAVRLYLVLSKASDNETKTNYWGRKRIAEAMRLKSPRSVDRYLGELAAIGALKIRAQFKDDRQTTNEYQVVTVDPSQYSARGVADLKTPGVAESCAPEVAENCSQSYNQYDLRTSTNLPTVAGAPSETPDGFEDFWEVYPRKKEKKRAQAAWKSAVKREPAAGIITAAKNYAEERKSVKDGEQFTKHASTWLNNDCWEDYRTSTVKASPVFWADAL